MDYYLTFISEWYGSIAIGMAIAWYVCLMIKSLNMMHLTYELRVVWRASQVLLKPVEELINLLGLDVPLAPTLALAGLKADGFLLRWKQVEQRGPTVRFHMTINGVNGRHQNFLPVHTQSNSP